MNQLSDTIVVNPLNYAVNCFISHSRNSTDSPPLLISLISEISTVSMVSDSSMISWFPWFFISQTQFFSTSSKLKRKKLLFQRMDERGSFMMCRICQTQICLLADDTALMSTSASELLCSQSLKTLAGSIGKETTPWSSSSPPTAGRAFSRLVRKDQRDEAEMSKDKITTI
ncbi:hypothetical protein HNY73_018814 [Argiope bruennichi]|uniref:Uncharacterized protein n=1 Tax=Argiope bruennichi TaxID=94029 RepID=A0A8T0EJ67_ARGBR|nr:hypothetical protein HNY73_018814 [Argiope bruennichi]